MQTILIIEDNKNILENMIEYFKMEGYKMLFANNGREGIVLAGEFIPDLIICDMLMPEMDGHEVLEQLLASFKTFTIPFIFSTSCSEKIDRDETMKLGADAYIVKPYEPETLLKIARQCIMSGSKRYLFAQNTAQN